jgi:hypothetical protein
MPFKDNPQFHVTQYIEIRQTLRNKLRQITPNEWCPEHLSQGQIYDFREVGAVNHMIQDTVSGLLVFRWLCGHTLLHPNTDLTE